MHSVRLLILTHHIKRSSAARRDLIGAHPLLRGSLIAPIMVGNIIKIRGFRTGNDAGKSGHDYIPPSILDEHSHGDPHIYALVGAKKRPPGAKTVEDFKNPLGADKNWISYGLSHTSYESDRNEYHHFIGMTVMIFLVLIPFYRIYSPDQYYIFAPERMWIKREARLELERREKLGLPPIDPDYVPRSQVQLPPKEKIEYLYRQDPDRWDSPGYERLGGRWDLTQSGDEMRSRALFGDINDAKPRLDRMVLPLLRPVLG
ncbi:NADH dehydrogenase [ubiquinone] 1 beta subcomplex subunit NP15.6 [Brevipalpus obovatus]|uniref:NADH dehydrogenase [ubiquinone] 1 beta subcomplex subunit NP15.6 n=1 Tax=Brevipalpus obovatus TaxID=246614 RepID=UPI003D9E7F17